MLQLSFICMFCGSLCVLLYFFFWQLCCLFFCNIRILIAPLVSSNSSYKLNSTWIALLFTHGTQIISLRLGFRRNFCLYLHPNLVSSPIKGILEIFNLTPGAFRWIFWHGRIVSGQVQVRFHK